MSRHPALLALLLCACAEPPAEGDLPETVYGHCSYRNPFSKLDECRDYLGDWPPEAAASDCTAQGSTIVVGAPCAAPAVLARCLLEGSDGYLRLTFPGEDASTCESLKTGCEFFAGGTYVPEKVCEGK